MVRGLLASLGRDGGEPFVGPRRERRVERQLVGRQEEQLRHRDCEVAVGQLDQQAVAKLPVVAQVRQRVLVLAEGLARVREQQARRAQLVERDVGERDVLFHLGRAGVPLGEPLRRDERVVTEFEQPVDGCHCARWFTHRCRTPSGTS
jgi:hypothetical protein